MAQHRIRRNSIELQAAARAMRKEATPAEAHLWQALRGSALGVRFRRQHPVGRFILDFWCPAARLVVEVDGAVHDEGEQVERDAERTALLELHDDHVIRFRNDEVVKDRDAVVERIRVELATRMQFPPSPAVRERGPGGEGQ